MIPPSDVSGSALKYWSASAWTASRPRPAAIATMAPLLSMPRARTPAAPSAVSNSPRPQPMSSTSAQPAKIGTYISSRCSIAASDPRN